MSAKTPAGEAGDMTATAKLEDYRRQIDALDDALIALLGRRYAAVRAVAAEKQAHGIPAFLPERVRAVIDRCAEQAAQQDLDPSFVGSLFGAIVGEACRVENRMMREAAAPASDS